MRKQLIHAATLLPLAIGLANTLAPPTPAPGSKKLAMETLSGGGALNLPCTLPFDSIRQFHPIDESCGAGGSATDDAQIAQNTAKNNFCATGPAVSLTFDNFVQLQDAAQQAGISFGSAFQVPKDRSPLGSLLSLPGSGTVGEGSVVRLAAYIIAAHYSNVSKGEGVNYKMGGQEDNDIHIVLGRASSNDDPCTSVTAEISPHFRPDIWAPDIISGLAARRFRFTGQLFFDASHRPCVSAQRSNPPRESLFEIHPVYAVDVCTLANPDQCDVDNQTNWKSLQDWLGTDSPTLGQDAAND